MNNNFKKLIIISLILLFTIFLLNKFNGGIETNKSDITNMKILNYIPSDNDLTILSNSTNNNIKRYIDENFTDKKRDELNMIKDSIISYLGFNLKEKFENIYDSEFALSFFGNKLKKIDILLIFKLKENKDSNHIINIEEELNKSDQIIELKRDRKINYISYIIRTKDNYLIASSDKKLIEKSLQSNNGNKILSKESIPDNINLKEIKLLSISKYINPDNKLNLELQTVNKLITIFNSEDNKIKLRSFSSNIDEINTKTLDNQIDNVKDIIFTNKYSTYKQNINFLYNKINQRELLEEISQVVNEELLYITNNDNWVLCFKSKLPNKVSIDELNFLKKYRKEDLYFNNGNYSIYTNDKLKIKDKDIIYEKVNPIFIFKDEFKTFISNNFEDLLNITETTNLSDPYLINNDEIKSYEYILNDIFFIKYINNEQLVKYYKSLKNLQFFINAKLFSLENINVNITHIIPEQQEKVYIESNLKIL